MWRLNSNNLHRNKIMPVAALGQIEIPYKENQYNPIDKE